jgi:hypothetical protein
MHASLPPLGPHASLVNHLLHPATDPIRHGIVGIVQPDQVNETKPIQASGVVVLT